MVEILQVGNRVIQTDEMLTLLTRYQLIPHLVRGLIIDDAIAEFSCTPEEIASALKSVEGQLQLTTPEAKEAWLNNQGMNSAQFEEITIRPILIEKFKQKTWSNKVESYFLSRKTHLDQVVYSLIRTKDLGLAQEIYFRIQEEEESFADLAREYSQGGEAHTGGVLGPVSVATPHPVLAKLLSISQPGQLWPPRNLGEWYVIVRLEKFIPAKFDDAMRRHLIDELFERWMREEAQKLGPIRALWSSETENA